MSEKIKWTFDEDGETLRANGKMLLKVSDVAYNETGEVIEEMPLLLQELLPVLMKIESRDSSVYALRVRVEDAIEKLLPH